MSLSTSLKKSVPNTWLHFSALYSLLEDIGFCDAVDKGLEFRDGSRLDFYFREKEMVLEASYAPENSCDCRALQFRDKLLEAGDGRYLGLLAGEARLYRFLDSIETESL